MRIGVVQFESGPAPEENLQRVTERIEEAASEGDADLVLLPEIWNVGYFAFDRYEEHAEPVEGPTIQQLAEVADEWGVYVHAGSIVERRDGDLYNTSVLLDPDGTVVETYRKIHLFGYESEEQALLTPGDRIVTAETSFGTVGMVTCYDLRFPELFRALAERGAELVLVTSAWPTQRLEHWLLCNRVRAVENQCYLAAANLTGTNEGVSLGGHSLVVDPWGTDVAKAGYEERTVYADLDPDAATEARDAFPALHDRRIRLTYEF